MRSGKLSLRHTMLTGVAASVLAMSAAVAQADAQSYDIEAQDLGSALQAYALQSGREVFFAPELVDGLESAGLTGTFSDDAALSALLRGADLTYMVTASNAILITSGSTHDHAGDGRSVAAASPDRPEDQDEGAQSDDNDDEPPRRVRTREEIEADEDAARQSRGLPERIVVRGSRNAGIRRFEDDAQPYVVFDASEIDASMSANLEDFLRTRLTQNTTTQTNSQFTDSAVGGNRSAIDLRGLGTNQTLILVNGRRVPSVSNSGLGVFEQPDINGIPLSAIERIEVLPSTASGIYGGGATGGVVNIILRQDYSGFEVRATYDNTFDTDVARRNLDFAGGFSLEGGRTRVFFNASVSDANELLVGDRDFVRKGRALQLRNDPDSYFQAARPPIGATSNISTQGQLDLARFFATGEIVFDFPELILDDGTPLGSYFASVPVGYGGVSTDAGAALAANVGVYNLDLPAGDPGLRSSLITTPSNRAFSGDIRREFTDSIDGFFSVSMAENDSVVRRGLFLPQFDIIPGDAPNNPFQNDIVVSYPVVGPTIESETASDTLSVSGGANWVFRPEWSAEAYFSWARSRTETVTTSPAVQQVFDFGAGGPTSDGTLDILRDVNAFPLDFTPYLLPSPNVFTGPSDTTLKTASLSVAGPVFKLPGGSVNLATLIEYREEEFDDAFVDRINAFTPPFEGFTTVYYPSRNQDVLSFYAEALIPLVSSANSFPGAELLELQLSARRDDYETRSVAFAGNTIVESRDAPLPEVERQVNEVGSTDFTAALRFGPIEDVTFRGSFSTGFLAPSLNQIAATEILNTFTFLSDPQREGFPVLISLDRQLVGGNPDLMPEESESISLGVIVEPRFVPGLQVIVDYLSIEKTDEISGFGGQFIVDNEDLFPGRIVRGELTADDIALGYAAGPIIELNETIGNIGRTEVEAVDIKVNYAWESARLGAFSLSALATKNLTAVAQFRPDIEAFNNAGHFAPEWRGNLGLTWDRDAWSAGWNMQHYGSYLIFSPDPALRQSAEPFIRAQGSEAIESQTYHDVFVRYQFDEETGFSRVLQNTEIFFGIQNVLNDEPPILARRSTEVTGGYQTLGDPRLRRYSIRITKAF